MTLGWSRKGRSFFDRQIGAGGFQMGRGDAGGELDADVHDRLECGIQEEADAVLADDIGDLVRIADHRRHAIGQDAAVEFMRGDERGFDVQMRVYEAGDDDLAGDVDLFNAPIIGAGADDAVAGDGDVGSDELAGDEIEETAAFQDDFRRDAAGALVDHRFELHHSPPYFC